MRALLLLMFAGLIQEPSEVKSPEKLRECFRQAMNAAATIKSDYLQSDVMSEIAEVQGRAGWADEALETIEAMTYDYHQSLAYAYVARELGKVGEVREARRILERGLKSTDDGEQDFKTGNAYGHIAVSFAMIGDIDRALKEAPEGGWGPDSFALKEIAKLLARNGDIDRALQVTSSFKEDDRRWVLLYAVRDAIEEKRPAPIPGIAARIEDESIRSTAWEEYSEYLVKLGRFDEAERIIESISSPYERIRAAATCGTARAKLDLARLKATDAFFEKLKDPQDHPHLRLMMARWRAAAGEIPAARADIETALKQIPALEEEWRRNDLRATAAAAYAAIGLDQEALDLASTLPDNPETGRSSALKGIAIAQADRGKMDRFESTLKSCSHPVSRAQARFEAARHRKKEEARRLLQASFEDLKDTDVGFRGLNDMRNGTPEFSLLHDLVDGLAAVGDYDTAVKAALKGEKDQRGGRVGGFIVRRMARHQVAAGQYDAAIAWIRKLEDAESRCLAYVGAAEGLIEDSRR